MADEDPIAHLRLPEYEEMVKTLTSETAFSLGWDLGGMIPTFADGMPMEEALAMFLELWPEMSNFDQFSVGFKQSWFISSLMRRKPSG